ncbi:MAG: hypothetical protein J7M30_12595, partial [Deltaproteobacteria bacterium]|nr:hypothetical protein [Deltaproteobacteria bacterium]
MTTKENPSSLAAEGAGEKTGCPKDSLPGTICQAQIPSELTKLPQWLLWKSKTKDNGKTTKIPFSVTGKKAKSDNPKTWTTYQDALSRYKAGGYSGIGFAFSQDDPFCGVDLDSKPEKQIKCRDPETGKIEPWAEKIIKDFKSYCEISPSGTGVHIICKGQLPEGGRKRPDIEIYDHGRYFTVTGNHLQGTPQDIRPAQDAINALLASHFKKEKPLQAPRPSSPQRGCESDTELIEKAIQAGNGHKFNLLYQGQWQEAGYPSQSEGDQAFC